MEAIRSAETLETICQTIHDVTTQKTTMHIRIFLHMLFISLRFVIRITNVMEKLTVAQLVKNSPPSVSRWIITM
jgi:hypothetical protein